MRIQGHAVSPWQREYVQNSQPVKQDTETEGVRFERTVQDMQKPEPQTTNRTASKGREQASSTRTASELLSLLSPEEKSTLAQLFPEKGPEWGVGAYQRAAKPESQSTESGARGHIDLLG